MTIRPVFSGTVPYLRCLSRNFFDISPGRTPAARVFERWTRRGLRGRASDRTGCRWCRSAAVQQDRRKFRCRRLDTATRAPCTSRCCPSARRVFFLHMRWSGVTDITRRHVGGILNMNEDWVKCGNLTVLLPRLFADRVFHTQAYVSVFDVTLLQQAVVTITT